MPTSFMKEFIELKSVFFILIALVAVGLGMIAWGEIVNFEQTPHFEYHNKLGALYKTFCPTEGPCVKVN